jgi:hypothetical protein
MRIVLFIIQKEFLQIFRNKGMLPIIFVVPLVQLLILVNAATFEMKHIKDLGGRPRPKFGDLPQADQQVPGISVLPGQFSSTFSYDQAEWMTCKQGKVGHVILQDACNGFEKAARQGEPRQSPVCHQRHQRAGRSRPDQRLLQRSILLDFNHDLLHGLTTKPATAGRDCGTSGPITVTGTIPD